MFDVVARDGDARVGRLETPHGTLETPAFLPVATRGMVKGLTPEEVRGTGTRGLIANAFHLWLNTGEDVIQSAGGIHGFMGWGGPIFTDSGGFQILRRDFPLRVTPGGLMVKTKDGREHLFTPAECMEVQRRLGSDVAMALDHCPPYGRSMRHHADALEDTIAWGGECLAKENGGTLVFGILQGGTFPELRRKAWESMAPMPWDGLGIGGLCIGEPREEMYGVLRHLLPLMDQRPRHLLGVGSPREIVEAVALGVDLFDSAYPTRNGRHGSFYTRTGMEDIGDAQHRQRQGPLVGGCGCTACSDLTAAYLHHAHRQGELVAGRLLSIHNLFFLQELMAKLRLAIREGTFAALAGELGAGLRTYPPPASS